MRKRLPHEFPGVAFSFLPADIVSQILNFGVPAPIDIEIVGRDVQGNRAFANRLLAKIRRVPGLVDARIQQPSDLPSINVEVDRTKALQAGFTQRDVANNLLITLSGSQQTTPTFWLNPANGVSYNVITSAPQYDMDSLQSVANIPVTSATRQDEPARLARARSRAARAMRSCITTTRRPASTSTRPPSGAISARCRTTCSASSTKRAASCPRARRSRCAARSKR